MPEKTLPDYTGICSNSRWRESKRIVSYVIAVAMQKTDKTTRKVVDSLTEIALIMPLVKKEMINFSLVAIVRFFYEWAVTFFAVIFFLSSGLAMSLLSLCIKPFLSRSQAQSIGRNGFYYWSRVFFSGLSLSGLVTTDFKALDCISDQRGIIITPNHPCLMDALFISSRLPNVVCVMKASILTNPIFYGFASLGGFISSDSPVRFVQLCQEALQDGAQLLLFPEGTRTLTENVNPFRGGFSLIALKTCAPIQTVFIHANTQFLGKHWTLLQKPPFPLIYRISLGDRFLVNKEQDHRVFTSKLENYFKLHL